MSLPVDLARLLWRQRPSLPDCWAGLLAVLDALLRCWFIVVVAVIAPCVLAVMPPGREALFVASEDDRQAFLLYAVLVLGAVQATLFAAVVLDRPPVPASRVEQWARIYTPVLIGLLAVFCLPVLAEYVILAPETLPAARGNVVVGLSWLVVAAGGSLVPLARIAGQGHTQNHAVGFIVLGVFAAAMSQVLSLVGAALLLAVVIAIVDGASWHGMATPASIRGRKGVALVLAVCWISLAITAAAAPLSRAATLGPAAALVVAVQFWLNLGLIATVAGRGRVPRAITTLAVVGLLWAFVTGPFNREDVRTLDTRAPVLEPLGAHMRDWLGARADAMRRDAPYPVFIVTADGGGIRAGYWTAAVLATLQDAHPAFASRVVAISGVSGGSLGAAVFGGLVGSDGLTEECRARLAACGARVLGHDFLGPTLATALGPDIARTILRTNLFPDRASVLEEAFEGAWRLETGNNAFAEPFDALWRGDRRLTTPPIYLNGTEVTTARRAVVGSTAVGDAMPEAIDLGVLTRQRAIRLSTGVTMSARFPVMSPIGSIPHGGAAVHIVDGGYHDNSGSATARDVLAELLRQSTQLGLSITPVLIVITNAEDALDRFEPGEAAPPLSEDAASTLGALQAPLSTLEQIRQAATRRFRQELYAAVQAAGGVIVDDFRLADDAVPFPLTWGLSALTRTTIDEQIARVRADSAGPFARVGQMLRR